MLTIRKETPKDIPGIRRVLEAAFGRSSEADLVDTLRAANALLLSLVAVEDGAIRGHIAFSPVTIESERSTCDAVGLAPVAVFPQHQHRAIGSELVRRGLDECRRRGHPAVVVLGAPEFYKRFGFSTSSARGIRCSFDVPEEAFMVMELMSGALAGQTGTVRYRSEFDRVSHERAA